MVPKLWPSLQHLMDSSAPKGQLNTVAIDFGGSARLQSGGQPPGSPRLRPLGGAWGRPNHGGGGVAGPWLCLRAVLACCTAATHHAPSHRPRLLCWLPAAPQAVPSTVSKAAPSSGSAAHWCTWRLRSCATGATACQWTCGRPASCCSSCSQVRGSLLCADAQPCAAACGPRRAAPMLSPMETGGEGGGQTSAGC